MTGCSSRSIPYRGRTGRCRKNPQLSGVIDITDFNVAVTRALLQTWTLLENSVPKDLFRSEVQAWAKRIGVEPKEVHIRPMKRKRGSCSSNGRVSFNAELLEAPADVRKGVVVEELLHLEVPNHGRVFRAPLRAYLG